MTNNLEISNLSLLLSSVLLIVALLIDYKEKLGLGNDIFIAGIRAVVQLFLIGYVLSWTPSQIVPITGMIASNAMTAIGVTYRSLNSKFTDQRQQVLEKLALGANKKQASMSIVRESVKTGMAPSIDRTKTVGLVSLPGMMSGLIFAGIDPVQAIRYQIVVMFMLISVTAISSFIASYMAYREFYNNRSQLII